MWINLLKLIGGGDGALMELENTMEGDVLAEVLFRWASPWINMLVVNVLGRRINFRMIETKIQRN